MLESVWIGYEHDSDVVLAKQHAIQVANLLVRHSNCRQCFVLGICPRDMMSAGDLFWMDILLTLIRFECMVYVESCTGA